MKVRAYMAKGWSDNKSVEDINSFFPFVDYEKPGRYCVVEEEVIDDDEKIYVDGRLYWIPKEGEYLLTDDSVLDKSCSERMSKIDSTPLVQSNQATPTPKVQQQRIVDKMQIGTRAFGVLYCILGVVSSILAFITYGMSTGLHEGNNSYGGDAYTGIQNAAAQTANNIIDLAEIVKFGFGSLLLIAGIFLLIYGICKMKQN